MPFVFRCSMLAAVLCLLASGYLWSPATLVQAASVPEETGAAEPVEPDMHEFMEYVFQPAFKRLKPAMATAPSDNAGWKVIKSDALILAEAGNLLLMRPRKNDVTDWVKHSVQVRDFGGQLYRAAKARDYELAKKHYESMVRNCNACHQQFAGGEHILTP